jgi:hypothetical protein
MSSTAWAYPLAQIPNHTVASHDYFRVTLLDYGPHDWMFASNELNL